MTILNTASDGFFNVLIVLHRTLASYGPMDRERLIVLCSPDPDSDNARLGATLLRWTQLGLFKEGEDGKYRLDKVDKDPERLPSICRRLLFSEANNQNFWDSKGTLSADFTRALAFILAQDIYFQEFDTHARVQALEQRQLADEGRRVLQNDVRWNGLRFWGEYLGFFWVDLRRWPDPTVAIRDALPSIFAERGEIAAPDFIEHLSEQLPVLDGGRYRVEVESALDPAEWIPPANRKMLSTSLSRALWRLSQPGGPLRIPPKLSDAAGSRTLQGAGGREWQIFTHVQLTEGA